MCFSETLRIIVGPSFNNESGGLRICFGDGALIGSAATFIAATVRS
jgi:hypothetical protein